MSERLRAVLAVAGVSALVALVAVASRGNAPRLGEDAPVSRPPALIADYLATLALLIVPLGAVVIVWAMLQRRMTPQKKGTGRSPAASLVLFALLVGLAFLAVRHLSEGEGPRLPTTPTQTATTGTKGKGAQREPAPRKAQFQWLAALVVGSIALAFGGALAYGAMRRRGMLASGLTERAVADVLEESLDDLRDEPDPRKAVIRTYARMERVFRAHGLPRKPFEAPLEYLERMLGAVEASAYSVRRLTQLFERARFSEHEVDGGMRDEAIEALVALREELATP
ncbi:MAG TPA: DUF4129 domain-containing protein [Gaiellaceae bacterium]|nr:DUF4129 domain-containing protein [Gaiellaceae bacterium]